MLHIIRDVMEDAAPLSRGLIDLATRILEPTDVREPIDEEGTLLGIAVERFEAVDKEGSLPRIGRLKLGIFSASTSWIDAQRAMIPNVPVSLCEAPINRIIYKNFVDWVRGTFHGISAKYLAAYAREFEFRFNHRRHASILPGLIGKRLMRKTSRRRADLIRPRPLLIPTRAGVSDDGEPDTGDDGGDRDDDGAD